jgi:hypothetical protein
VSTRQYFASLTRISDLETRAFDFAPLPRASWATGDYVVAEVVHAPRESNKVESSSGRDVEVVQGDPVVGALGVRAATLGAVGSWEAVGDDGVLEALTAAGLFGRATSVAWHAPRWCGWPTRATRCGADASS